MTTVADSNRSIEKTFGNISGPHSHWFFARVRAYREQVRRRRRRAHISSEHSVPPRLPHSVRFGYSMGHVLNDLCASMWFTYSLVFYTAVIGLSHTMAGLLMIIGQIADAIGTPVVGVLSDRGQQRMHDSQKNRFILFFGKRKSFYIIGTALIVCTKPFMLSPCFLCSKEAVQTTNRSDAQDASIEESSEPLTSRNAIEQIIYYASFIVLFQWGWAAVQTVHLAMAADLTPYDSERTFLLSLRNTMTAVCNALTYVGQWVTIAVSNEQGTEHQIGPNDTLHFQIVVLSIVIIGTITSLIFIRFVPETPSSRDRFPSLESTSVLSQGSSTHGRHTILGILSHWRLHYIGFIYMNTRIFVVSVQALLTLYLHESLRSYAYELASIPLVLNIVCFCSSLAFGFIRGIIGRKSVYVLGTTLGVGASVWTYFGGTGYTYRHGLIYVIASLYGAASAFLQVTALSLVADHIGEDIHDGAFIYGYMSFLDKVATGVLLAVIMHFHDSEADRDISGFHISHSNYFTYAVAFSSSLSSLLGCTALLVLQVNAPLPPIIASLPEGSQTGEKKMNKNNKVKVSI